MIRRKEPTRGVVLALALLLGIGGGALRAAASNGSIDIFGDRAGTTCSKTMATVDSIYIMARPGGATADGIGAAYFRIDGVPSSWISLGVLESSNVLFWIGHPLNGIGTGVALQCEAEHTNGLVPIFTLPFYIPPNAPPLEDVRLSVREFPQSPTTTTPLLASCKPDFPPYVALGGQFIANPVHSSCTVAIQPATWSVVKKLYQFDSR